MSSETCTILMIGGDRDSLAAALARARAMAWVPVTADSVESGARVLAVGGIDVAVFDPGAAPGDAAADLRRLRGAGDIPVIVVSDPDDRDRAPALIREGADDCLAREQIPTAAFERTVRRAVARARFRQRRRDGRGCFSSLITRNADAIVVISRGGVIRYANPAAEAMFGRGLADLVGTLFGCPVTGPGRTEVDILRPDEPPGVAEMRLVDSEWDGEPVYLATLRDMGERKAAEEALRQYQRIFTAFSDPICLLDAEGRVLLANRSFHRWFRTEGLPGQGPVLDGIDDRFREEHLKPGLLRCIGGEEIQVQTWLHLPDGTLKYTSNTFDPFRDANGTVTGCIWTLRDLSETRSLEDQLRQSQKMEAIGTLAGGIAHNFNNLLMGIQGRSSLMLMDTGSDHPFVEHLRGIEALVREAAGLTKQLLGYARGGKYDPVATDVNALVAKTLHMFASTRKEIDIVEVYAPDLWRAEVDQSQFSQVLLNMFVNASQAMARSGRLGIATENRHLDSRTAASRGVAAGRYVVVHVQDNGRGMERANLHRIFDPFFTTKGAGRGTGLGLASAYGIIRNHHGFIDVESDLGRGARFSIHLPATEKAVPVALNGARQRIVKGNETILLVDDEPGVLDVGRRILERLGYTVWAAGSGMDALEIYRTDPRAIDLVVLDMVMPGMGGGETFDRLREIDSGVKVLLASGYSIEGQADQIMARGCDGFIQKPFDIAALSAKLRSLLDPK